MGEICAFSRCFFCWLTGFPKSGQRTGFDASIDFSTRSFAQNGEGNLTKVSKACGSQLLTINMKGRIGMTCYGVGRVLRDEMSELVMNGRTESKETWTKCLKRARYFLLLLCQLPCPRKFKIGNLIVFGVSPSSPCTAENFDLEILDPGWLTHHKFSDTQTKRCNARFLCFTIKVIINQNANSLGKGIHLEIILAGLGGIPVSPLIPNPLVMPVLASEDKPYGY